MIRDNINVTDDPSEILAIRGTPDKIGEARSAIVKLINYDVTYSFMKGKKNLTKTATVRLVM